MVKVAVADFFFYQWLWHCAAAFHRMLPRVEKERLIGNQNLAGPQMLLVGLILGHHSL